MRVDTRAWPMLIALAIAMIVVSCSSSEQKSAPAGDTGAAAAAEEDTAMGIQLTSTAFENGKTIPTKHTCDAANVSPALKWSKMPDGTKSIALICDDPDAPMGTWVHWVLFDMPATVVELQEGVPTTETLANGGKQGANSSKKLGYTGPCPPPGKPHRYFFKLYALDSPLGLKPGAKKGEVVKAMEGHVLGEAQLMGTYGR